jgi:hypothetical protein
VTDNPHHPHTLIAHRPFGGPRTSSSILVRRTTANTVSGRALVMAAPAVGGFNCARPKHANMPPVAQAIKLGGLRRAFQPQGSARSGEAGSPNILCFVTSCDRRMSARPIGPAPSLGASATRSYTSNSSLGSCGPDSPTMLDPPVIRPRKPRASPETPCLRRGS